MNKQKWLEDRYSEINRDGPKTDGLFVGISCEACSAIHGSALDGGGRVILTVVGNKILCYADGVKEAERISRPKAYRKPKDALKSFGLEQGELF